MKPGIDFLKEALDPTVPASNLFYKPSRADKKVAELFRESSELGPILERWALADEMGTADHQALIGELRAFRMKCSEYVTDHADEMTDEHELLEVAG